MKRRNKLRAAILYSVFSDAEADQIILQDVQHVQQALVRKGFKAILAPVAGAIFEVMAVIKRIKPSVIVNLCEAFCGKSSLEAQVAGLLELTGIPFTGNGSNALLLCQDKFRAKAVLRSFGLPTPRGWLVGKESDLPEKMDYPLIVKPNLEDGGVGIYAESVVYDGRALADRVRKMVMKYNQPALIEEFIAGREFNVAIIDNPLPEVLPLSEINFTGLPAELPRVVGYEAKWIKDHPFYRGTTPVCPAKDVSKSLAASLRALALRTWRVMRLSGYARIDLRVADGKPYIIDVNPNPDAADDAGLARSLRAAGISREEFWHGQAMLAIARRKKENENTGINGIRSGGTAEGCSFHRHIYRRGGKDSAGIDRYVPDPTRSAELYD